MTSEASSTEETVNQEKLVELIPVPDDDIAKHAKPKCTTCSGRGKLSIRTPDSKSSQIVVCRCALNRFVAANRSRLAVGRDRKLYYRALPEGVAETESEQEAGESEAPAAVGGDAGRLQVMRERVAALDEKIKEVEDRYARQLESFMEEAEEAERDLARELLTSQDLRNQQSEIIAQIISKNEEIRRLEMSLESARKNKAILEQEHDANVVKQVGETARVAPFAKDLEVARAAVAEVNKKLHQALAPHRQRRASLLKRLAHKAASLGLPLPSDDVLKGTTSSAEVEEGENFGG